MRGIAAPPVRADEELASSDRGSDRPQKLVFPLAHSRCPVKSPVRYRPSSPLRNSVAVVSTSTRYLGMHHQWRFWWISAEHPSRSGSQTASCQLPGTPSGQTAGFLSCAAGLPACHWTRPCSAGPPAPAPRIPSGLTRCVARDRQGTWIFWRGSFNSEWRPRGRSSWRISCSGSTPVV